MAKRCISGVLAVLLCVTWFYLLLASAWFICNDPSKGLSGMSHALIKGYFPVLIIYAAVVTMLFMPRIRRVRRMPKAKIQATYTR